MGEELRSRGHFSKKPPSFGRGFANFLTEITQNEADSLIHKGGTVTHVDVANQS